MAESALANQCLHIPIDHRLRSLLRPDLPNSYPRAGRAQHAMILEKYGRALKAAGEKISLPEIEFAKKLAMPETKGGVLVLLQQPAPNQQYDGRDFNTIVQECETLSTVDDVLRAVIGSRLEETSCFDAFPFQKVPIPPRSETGYSEYSEAYEVCDEMVHEKQPDVVLCCYKSPDITKFKLLYSRGVGKMRTLQVKLGRRDCTPVNAFHPSYAVNYNKGESCFRTLYMLEALKAFHEFSRTWKESKWMDELRLFCEHRAKHLAIGRCGPNGVDSLLTSSLEKEEIPELQNAARWEQSFRDGLTGLKTFFSFMCSNDAATLSDRDLYNRVIGDNISRLACDCLLVMTFVVQSWRADDPLPDARNARNARSVARPIPQSIIDFPESTLEGPLQTIKERTGFVEDSALERLSRLLRIPTRRDGLQYSLKTSLQTLMTNLSKSFIYKGSKYYSTNFQLIKKAFSSFAHQLEHAFEQHMVANSIQENKDISCLASRLSSVELDTKQDNASVQSRATSSAIDRARQLSPQKQPVVTVAATLTQTAITRGCFQCQQPGHFKDQCPQIRCYRCVY